MSGFYEVLSWLIYALATVMMLVMIGAAILTGLAVRFVAEFLREFVHEYLSFRGVELRVRRA